MSGLDDGRQTAETPEELRIPVAGGQLTVLRWAASDPGAPVVLALHGITANALAWLPVARALAGRATLLAPDLRGRAGSAGLPGPYGIEQHVADVAAVAQELALAPVRLTGHSMGAFVAARTLAVHPQLAESVLLIDGGVGFPAPTHLSPDDLLTAVIGPAMTRLAMTFENADAYRAFWQAHPALGPWWSADLETYVQRDLVGEEPRLRSSCVPDAIRADGVGLFAAEVLAAVHRLPVRGGCCWRSGV
ncbi:alpha/beta fold hydrolase [Streptacidiphilus monticola]